MNSLNQTPQRRFSSPTRLFDTDSKNQKRLSLKQSNMRHEIRNIYGTIFHDAQQKHNFNQRVKHIGDQMLTRVKDLRDMRFLTKNDTNSLFLENKIENIENRLQKFNDLFIKLDQDMELHQKHYQTLQQKSPINNIIFSNKSISKTRNTIEQRQKAYKFFQDLSKKLINFKKKKIIDNFQKLLVIQKQTLYLFLTIHQVFNKTKQNIFDELKKQEKRNTQKPSLATCNSQETRESLLALGSLDKYKKTSIFSQKDQNFEQQKKSLEILNQIMMQNLQQLKFEQQEQIQSKSHVSSLSGSVIQKNSLAFHNVIDLFRTWSQRAGTNQIYQIDPNH